MKKKKRKSRLDWRLLEALRRELHLPPLAKPFCDYLPLSTPPRLGFLDAFRFGGSLLFFLSRFSTSISQSIYIYFTSLSSCLSLSLELSLYGLCFCKRGAQAFCTGIDYDFVVDLFNGDGEAGREIGKRLERQRI